MRTFSRIIILILTGLLTYSVIYNISEKTESENATPLYVHHFDVVFTPDQLEISNQIPFDLLDINFNVISNRSEPYAVLSDIDGDGYIISAFGEISVNNIIVGAMDARIVYDGNILIYITTGSGTETISAIVSNMGDYPIIDSVTKI